MGELRRKTIPWILGVILFIFFLLVLGGGRYLVRKFVEELTTRYRISVTVGDVTPLFLGVSLRDVALEGKGFSLRASRLLARLSWRKGIALALVDGEFSFSRDSLSSLELLPPFFLEVRRGRFAGVPGLQWDGWIEKSGDSLRFGAAAGDLSLVGGVRSGVVAFSGAYRASPFQGTFSLDTGAFSGTFGEVRLEGILSPKEDAWQIAPLSVSGKGGIFSGECTLSSDARLELSGVLHAFGTEVPLTLSGYFTFPVFAGELRSGNLLGRVEFDFRSTSFRLIVHPQSVWREYRVSGILEGQFRDDVTVELRNVSVDAPEKGISFTLDGKLRGKGDALQGDAVLRNFTGKIRDWELREGEFVVHLDGRNARFSGGGKLLGGWVSLFGEYRDGRIRASGKIEEIPVARVIAKEDIPLSGTVAAAFSLEGEWGHLAGTLALTGGHLSFRGVDLGDIVSGEVESSGDTVALKNLLLVRKGGRFLGTLFSDAAGIRGEGVFEAYPLEFSWQEKDVRLLLHGTVHFQDSKGYALRFALSVPSWSFGTLEGRDLTVIGELQDRRVGLENLSLLWDGGFLRVQGDLVFGERVHLEGEVVNLRIPESDFPVGGTIARARLSVSGSWEDVRWVFEGESSSLRTADFPLGEEVTLKLAGRISLAHLLERHSSVLEVLHPQNLDEGTITVRGVNLALFGGAFLSKVPGTLDMHLVLDTRKNLWRFASDTVAFSFPPYGDFTGRIQGTYDGQCFAIEHVSLEGRGGISLSGKGSIDTVARNLDIWVSGKAKTLVPFGDYAIDLEAEGQVHVFGSLTSPSLEGTLYIPKVRVTQGDREHLFFEGISGEIFGNVLRLSGRRGTFPGGRITRLEGAVDSSGVTLSGDFEGEGSFPGFAEVFQGQWTGTFTLSGRENQYTLQGDITVSQASIDTRRVSREKLRSLAMPSEFFGKLPLSVKLRVALEDTLLVRTDFLHLVLSGGMSLSSEEGRLSLQGRFDVLEGTYDLVACTIPLEGYIAFTDFGGYTPELHLEGRKRVQGYDVQVRVRGPLSDYEVDLTSDPPLSKEEVLSLLFFGDKDAYLALHRVNLTPLLAKAARFFLGKDWTLRMEPFFDAVTFDPEDFSRITFEKRLGKDVAIGYTQNLTGGESAFRVDVDLSKEWSFRFERKESGETEWMLQFATKF